MATISQSFDRMLSQFFKDDSITATYIKETVGDYDPTTGTSPSTVVETQVSVIVLDMLQNSNGLSSKFGTEILEGDKEAYILPPEKKNPSATPLVLSPNIDKLKVGNKYYKIFKVKEGNHGGSVTVAYNVMLRL